MAEQIQVAGKVTVKVDTTGGGTTETLGECLDMAEVTDNAFYHDVHGDRHGGPQGPPIDVQFLGRTVRVRCELSRYDQDVADKVRARLRSNGAALAGTVQDADIGALMLQDSKTMRVVLSNSNNPLNFPLCIVREPIELPVGTKFSSLMFEFEAHRNQTTGILFNSTNS